MAALAQQTASLLAFPSPAQNLRAALTPALKHHRLPDDLAESLIREAASHAGNLKAALTTALSARMRQQPVDFKNAQRIFLIGPPGSGKSAVAAKLARMAAAHNRSDLVISDSAGFNPRSLRAQSAFSGLGARDGVETIGVISALTDAEDMRQIVRDFRLSRLIITGLDMAGRFGALAAAVTCGASLAGIAKAAGDVEKLTAKDLAALLLD